MTATSEDVWTVVLYEIMMHIQKFVDTNPMDYRGKEKKAYTTGLGMISILCKRMIEDIKEQEVKDEHV
tara:strand:- start:337 stop:540 length:204 start_codon:yes stop_codon:yes gene_type:complete